MAFVAYGSEDCRNGGCKYNWFIELCGDLLYAFKVFRRELSAQGKSCAEEHAQRYAMQPCQTVRQQDYKLAWNVKGAAGRLAFLKRDL